MDRGDLRFYSRNHVNGLQAATELLLMPVEFNPMRTIIAVPDQALNHDLVTALAEFPEIEIVRQVAHYLEPDDFLRIIRARKPDFVFLSTEDFPKFQALAAVIDDRMPGLPVISVAREADPMEVIPKLMHLGVRELLASPITHEKLGETIASIARQLVKHPTPVVRLGISMHFSRPSLASALPPLQ
jgi:DNA-binding NarL/FixJ family response regulator